MQNVGVDEVFIALTQTWEREQLEELVNHHYRDAFNDLYRRTQEQIAALEAFAQVDWRE